MALRRRYWPTQKNIHVLAAGGTANHLHLLILLPQTITLAKAMQELKANTSRWLRETSSKFQWQEGYGAFSVSQSQRETVTDVHREPGRTSPHAKLRTGVYRAAPKIGNSIRSAICFWMKAVSPLRGWDRPNSDSYPALRRWARLFRPLRGLAFLLANTRIATVDSTVTASTRLKPKEQHLDYRACGRLRPST